MKPLQPIMVTHLFPKVWAELLSLLSGLSPTEWDAPTACSPWTVKEVAQHLLGGDVAILSRKRDGYTGSSEPIKDWPELIALINALNDTWITATRRMSPRVLCDLLEFTGRQVYEYFQSLDPEVLGEPVSWAGSGPAPVWLDLAREYTERWHHQQHIRDAVGKPGLKEVRFFAPVLDAFIRAWPHTYRDVEAKDGTLISLIISGEAGGRWFLLRQDQTWQLYLAVVQTPQAEVVMPQEVAWRLFTKGLTQEEAQKHTNISGNQQLGAKILDMVSIIA